jgi:hypothetical protein
MSTLPERGGGWQACTTARHLYHLALGFCLLLLLAGAVALAGWSSSSPSGAAHPAPGTLVDGGTPTPMPCPGSPLRC